jgi:hypothetical protein
MRNYINLFESEEKIDEVYSRDNQYVKQVLGSGEFDGYRFWGYADEWMNTQDEEEIEEVLGEPFDAEENEQYEKLTPDLQKDFAEWVGDYLSRHDPAELPSSHYFDSDVKRIPRTTWLVHFTDHAESIIGSGFTHGTHSADELGLTTYVNHDSKKHGGFNFAFIADGRDALVAANKNKYGKNFVMFQNSGVETYHYSDEENQIVFWGPDVDRRHIALVRQIDGDYHVISRMGMSLYAATFEKVVKWIIAHHRQYSKQMFA